MKARPSQRAATKGGVNEQLSRGKRPYLAALLLFIVVEGVLLALASARYRDTTEQIAFLSSEIRGIGTITQLIDTLRLLGQYRGACTATKVKPTANQALVALCEQRFAELDERLDANTGITGNRFPQLATQWAEINHLNPRPNEFFNILTELNSMSLAAIKTEYLESNLQLDPLSNTYFMAGLLADTLPQLMEKLGIVRGRFALVEAGNMPVSRYLRVIGAASAHHERTQDYVDGLRSRNDRGDVINLIDKGDELSVWVANYLGRQMRYNEQMSLTLLEQSLVAERFQEATLLIDEIFIYTQSIAKTLRSALQTIHTNRSQELSTQIGLLFALQITILLLIAALLKTIAYRQRANEELRSLVHKQGKMFGIIAHELRTPAATIDMICRDRDYSDEHRIADIASNSKHLLHIIDDLRVSIDPRLSIEVAPEATSLPKLIDQVTVQVRPLFEDGRMALQVFNRIDPRMVVSIDGYRFKTILTNLLRNAYQHSGATWVRLEALTHEDSEHKIRLRITVSDNGRGIDAAHWERLLQPFERDASSGGGTGAGLHIVNSWIQQMGGTVHLLTDQPAGTAIRIDMVVPKASAPESAEDERAEDTSPPLPSFHGQSILLVEDDPVLAKLTKRLLQRITQAEVETADNGLSGLRLLQERRPRLLITDHFMPQMSGVEMIKLIREQDEALPIIVITAATLGAEQDELLAAGANGVLSKPVTENLLRQTIADVLDLETEAGEA